LFVGWVEHSETQRICWVSEAVTHLKFTRLSLTGRKPVHFRWFKCD